MSKSTFYIRKSPFYFYHNNLTVPLREIGPCSLHLFIFSKTVHVKLLDHATFNILAMSLSLSTNNYHLKFKFNSHHGRNKGIFSKNGIGIRPWQEYPSCILKLNNISNVWPITQSIIKDIWPIRGRNPLRYN